MSLIFEKLFLKFQNFNLSVAYLLIQRNFQRKILSSLGIYQKPQENWLWSRINLWKADENFYKYCRKSTSICKWIQDNQKILMNTFHQPWEIRKDPCKILRVWTKNEIFEKFENLLLRYVCMSKRKSGSYFLIWSKVFQNLIDYYHIV